VNIVPILGIFYEKKKAVVYEFMSKGSLNKFNLNSEFSDSIFRLDWNTMYRLAIGIARGWEYLHQESTSSILNLDIKPNIIVLYDDFFPKNLRFWTT